MTKSELRVDDIHGEDFIEIQMNQVLVPHQKHNLHVTSSVTVVEIVKA